jgi:hypothetical protein
MYAPFRKKPPGKNLCFDTMSQQTVNRKFLDYQNKNFRHCCIFLMNPGSRNDCVLAPVMKKYIASSLTTRAKSGISHTIEPHRFRFPILLIDY